MNSSDSPAATPVLDLHSAIRRQSWSWLDAIVRRLDLSIEMIDEQGVLCPPLAGVSPAPALRKLLGAASPAALRTVLSAAVLSQERQRVAVENLDVRVVPLKGSPVPMGAVVLARSQSAAAPSASADAEIDAAGSWLARAI